MNVPWGCIMVSSSPLIGLRVAGVFTVLLCTCNYNDISSTPLSCINIHNIYIWQNIKWTQGLY